MIKIQEHLTVANPESFLNSLAEELWDSLNPKLANGRRLKKGSLIEKCKKYSSETGKVEYIKEYANNDPVMADRHKTIFEYLLANDEYELKRLITSRPTEFSSIVTNVYAILHADDLYTGSPGNYQQTSFGKLLSEKVFDYASFRGSDYCKELFSRIGFNSIYCPYCDDNQLSIVRLKNNSTQKTKDKAYLDLDHFYPKSIHPYFATSFFNLIPSCHSCNSTDKGDKPFTIETHIHPYHESFDDFYNFKVSLTSLLGDPIDIIEIKKNLNLKPLDSTLNDLNLEARYNNHLDQAQSLVKFFLDHKHYIGTGSESCFTEAINSLYGLPRDKKDILRHRLGKFKRDLIKQIDINDIMNLL